MEQGHFCFISDSFYERHDPENRLMKNKEGVYSRPCFYVFPDFKEPAIFWCVPISSQIEKFEKIFQRKIENQIAKGLRTPNAIQSVLAK